MCMSLSLSLSVPLTQHTYTYIYVRVCDCVLFTQPQALVSYSYWSATIITEWFQIFLWTIAELVKMIQSHFGVLGILWPLYFL